MLSQSPQRIAEAVEKRGQVVVSPDPYFLNKGDDCLQGMLEIYLDNNPDVQLYFSHRQKNRSEVYKKAKQHGL